MINIFNNEILNSPSHNYYKNKNKIISNLENNLIKNNKENIKKVKDLKSGKFLYKNNNSDTENINFVNIIQENNLNSNSERNSLLRKQNNNLYKEIFNLLDSDKDGLISYKKIRLSLLDNNLLKILTPILEELQQNNFILNYNEFIIKLDKCIQNNNIYKKK